MKAEQINDYIEKYLDFDRTKSAIMLTAGWGTGKSHYVKNELIPYLEQVGDYSCIVVSLYGMSSVKEISKSIYLEARTKKFQAKKEGGTLLRVAAKTLFRTVIDSKGFSVNISDDDLQQVYESIDLSRKLIVFEDVERAQFNVLEFLGYVNSLVEQDNVKVLLVTNEEELLKREPSKTVCDEKNTVLQQGECTESTVEYLRTKEKTVSDTIVYEPDYLRAIQAIVCGFENDRLALFASGDDLEKVQRILNQSANMNLRTFTFACQRVVDIFAQMPDNCSLENYRNIYFSVVAFSAHIKNGEFPKWEGTKHLSTALAVAEYPLYRFCYDYIRWREFDQAMVQEAFQEQQTQRLYNRYGRNDDNDFAILDNFYVRSEAEVTEALSRVEKRLENPEDVPFYAYGKLALLLIRFKTLLEYDYSVCKEQMIRNIRGKAGKIDAMLLFFGFDENIDQDQKKEYDAFKKDILDALNDTDELNGFTYTPEQLNAYYKDVCRNRESFCVGRQFISRYDIDKLVAMLMQCNAAQINNFRGVLWAVYRYATEESFVAEDAAKLSLMYTKLLRKKEQNELPADRIVRFQIDMLISNLEHFQTQLSGKSLP